MSQTAAKVSPSVNPFKYAKGIFVTVSQSETFPPHPRPPGLATDGHLSKACTTVAYSFAATVRYLLADVHKAAVYLPQKALALFLWNEAAAFEKEKAAEKNKM